MNPIMMAAALAGRTLYGAFPPSRPERQETTMVDPPEPQPPTDYDKPFSSVEAMQAAAHLMVKPSEKPVGVPWQRYINGVMPGMRPQEKARSKRRAHRRQANASRRRNR